MSNSLIITNGRVLQGHDLVRADVAIEQGKIVSIGTPVVSASAKTIDAEDLVVRAVLHLPALGDYGRSAWRFARSEAWAT